VRLLVSAKRCAPWQNMTHNFLSVDETCESLSIPRRTLYDWWKTGRGPRRIKLPNGRVMVRVDWLDDWLLGLEQGDAA
jgi:predicted DNA-binding transcriptional regulator AlpA